MIFGSELAAVDAGWLSEAEAAISAKRAFSAVRPGINRVGGRGVSVVPVMGLLTRRQTFYTDYFGGTTYTGLRSEFHRAMDDPQTEAVVLLVDSPGGDARGAEELSSEIFAARGRKRIVAVADGMAASAAYWIASAASEFYASPSADVGSLGVVMGHVERSKAEAKAGVKTTLIYSGKNKVLANSFEPLSEKARRVLQEAVDRTGDALVKTVARNRSVTPAEVRARYGEGLLFGADDALNRGLIDGIATFDAVVSGRGRPKAVVTRSALALRKIAEIERKHSARLRGRGYSW